jgi:hypothetical protein
MTDLKSLAHPGWPYAGTAHEWRGFVKDEKRAIQSILLSAPIPTSAQICHVSGVTGRVIDLYADPIYQKQNFGPELK